MKSSARWLATIIPVFAILASMPASADDCVPRVETLSVPAVRVETLSAPEEFVKFHFGCRDDALRHSLQIQSAGRLHSKVYTCPKKNNIDMVASHFRWMIQESIRVVVEKVKSPVGSKDRQEILDIMSDMGSEFSVSSDIKNKIEEFSENFIESGCVMIESVAH